MALGTLDPRQSLTLAKYKDPTSDTFGNLKRSMINAGYDEKYADVITSQKVNWISDNLKSDIALVQRAEANLKKYVELNITLDKKMNVDLAKLQVDVSKFLLKTLARRKYSEDKEVTPPQVQINIVNYNESKKDDDVVIKEADIN